MKIINVGAVGALCVIFFGPLRADEAAAPWPGAQQVVEYLAVQLTLSDAQKTAIEPVIAERQQKLRALRADTSLAGRARRHAALSILSDSDQKINAVLNADQQQHYAAIERDMMQHMRERGTQP